MTSPSLLLIQAGTPPEDVRSSHGDFPLWFSRVLGSKGEPARVVRVFEGEALPPPRSDQIGVITGSWSMVTDKHPWSEVTAQWIRQAMQTGVSMFGVCYGHQLMAHALGGPVDYHPRGGEIGCQSIRLLPNAASDTLLADFPATFQAHLMHEQSIVKLPPGAQVLASSKHDAYQIVRYGANAVSTQFHPEFTPAITEACIRRRADALSAEGLDVEEVIGKLRDTHEARELLARFVESADARRLSTARVTDAR